MTITSFKIPEHWPSDAKAFASEAISEIQELKVVLKQSLIDILDLKNSLDDAQKQILDLKEKLGTNSSNSSLPPSKDPPGSPVRKAIPTGRKQGAQQGHPGFGRKLFPSERIDRTMDVFPQWCPVSQRVLYPDELRSLSLKRVHQVDLPEEIRLVVAEIRLHTCLCPCGCGKTLTAVMPADLGNTAIGLRLKTMMSLLTSRFRLSKTLLQELMVDLFGSDAAFSTGCISEAEEEVSDALKAPYEEAREAAKHAPAVHVDETSWYLKHKLQWLWIAVTQAVSVFYIDPHRSRNAFESFLGAFEGC